MKTLRRVNRILTLMINAIVITLICIQIPPSVIHILLIPVLAFALEYVTILIIMYFKLEDIVSYRAFSADEYELNHFKKKS